MMQSINHICIPLNTGITKLPHLPYPYYGNIVTYNFIQRSSPNFSLNFKDGIDYVNVFSKNSVWPSRCLNLSSFLLNTLCSSFTSKLFVKIGLINSKSLPNFNMNKDSLVIITNRLRLNILKVQQEELQEQNPRIQGEKQIQNEKLENINKSIERLQRETLILEAKINNTVLRFKEYEKHSHDIEYGFKEIFFRWLASFLGWITSHIVFYPLFNITNWYIIHEEKISWFDSAYFLYSSILNGKKHPYDGFLLHILSTGLHNWLILPPIALLSKFMNLPDPRESKFHLEYLLVTLLTTDPDNEILIAPKNEKKKQIKESFNAIMKNSYAYSISNWFVMLLLYPIRSIQIRLICQDNDYRSYHYNNTLEAFQCVYNNEGIFGFYRGFKIRSLIIVPELCVIGLVHLLGNFLIDKLL